MGMPPLYGCRWCATRDAIVFCLHCAVRLCLHCDAAVHGAGAGANAAAACAWLHHERAPLCDACGDAAGAAALRSAAASATLCTGCCSSGGGGALAGISSSSVARRYTGCPGPTELLRLISLEAPQPQQDFEAWLAEKLLEVEHHDHHQLLLPEAEAEGCCYWDVALETARLEKMVADCITHTDESLQQQDDDPSSFGGHHHPSLLHLQPPQPQPAATASAHDHLVQMTADANQPPPPPPPPLPQEGRHQAEEAIMKIKKKQLERERAKLRYNEKKKRRFCRPIMYASRKARADTRKRIEGRFAKASAAAASTSSNMHG